LFDDFVLFLKAFKKEKNVNRKNYFEQKVRQAYCHCYNPGLSFLWTCLLGIKYLYAPWGAF
jgi:hypothetical protein